MYGHMNVKLLYDVWICNTIFEQFINKQTAETVIKLQHCTIR